MVEPTVLDLGSDVGIRNRYFSRDSYSHPAKLHLGLLQWIVDRYTQPGDTIADPMAGIGSVLIAALQQRHVIAREIEPRWLAYLHTNAARIYEQAGLLAGRIDIAQADAREPWTFTADHVVFSPPYGCAASSTPNQRLFLPYRMAIKTEHSYSDRWQQLIDNNSPGAAGAVQFFYGNHPAQIGALRDTAYWQAMTTIYTNAYAALGRGHLVLIIKDHIRQGRRVTVADDTVALCERLGFVLQERHARRVYPLSLWQRRRKEKGQPVIEDEDVLVFRKVAA